MENKNCIPYYSITGFNCNVGALCKAVALSLLCAPALGCMLLDLFTAGLFFIGLFVVRYKLD
jgi:hypothetical protein